MKWPSRASFCLAVLVWAVYLALTVLAILHYQGAFSPADNWLSDLGNRQISPRSARFYNSGVMASSCLLALFFPALGVMRLAGSRAQRLMLTLTQVLGVIAALGMFLSAVFSIDRFALHSAMSALFRISLGTAFGLSVAALAHHAGTRRGVLALGGLTTLLDLVVSVAFNRARLLEWPLIALGSYPL